MIFLRINLPNFVQFKSIKANRLTHLGEMPGVGERFARVGGFLST